MTTLHIDFETRSVVDLKRAGVYVYAADPSTDVWCAAYCVDDGPIKLWTPGGPKYNNHKGEPADVPGVVLAAYEKNWTIVAHNAAFERIIWRDVLAKKYGWPVPKLEQWRCTMVQALALSLPGSLENAAAAVGLDARKDMEGHNVMMRMAKPRRPRKGELPNGVYWFDDDERKQKLYAYCKNDVLVERELDKRLLPLRPSEQKLWQLDQKINDRGVFVDTALCDAALKIVDKAAAWLDAEMSELTRGFVGACSNVNQIIEWLRTYGGLPDADSIAKGAIDELLGRQGLTPATRRVLELRKEAAKASVSKIDALLAGKNADNRARGLLQFHAAGPGRWGGRRFQPHNLKRPELDEDWIDGAIDAVMTGDADTVQMVYGEPLSVVGDCLRGMIKASEGRKIVAADLSNIEGRVTAWVSGEEWKLQAFRDFDTFLLDANGKRIPDGKGGFERKGHDIYKIAAGGLLGIGPENVTKAQRQDFGKVQELASGFEGGIGAYMKFGMAAALPALTPIILESATPEELERARELCPLVVPFGLTSDEWIVTRIVVDRWRDRHPRTKQTWKDLSDAAISAVQSPGRIVSVGPVQFRTAGSFLFLRLPSGRCICYPYPRVVDKMTPWGAMKPTVCFKGVDTFTRKWGDCYAYGGLWMQNIAEGIARDVLAEGMTRLEAAGYPIILTVHDETVAEPKADHGSAAEFERIMVEQPAWAPGLPIAASGFEAERYRK